MFNVILKTPEKNKLLITSTYLSEIQIPRSDIFY